MINQNKRLDNLKYECRQLVGYIENCLKDDFKHFHRIDIKGWQKALDKIKKKSDRIPLLKEKTK